MPNRNEDFGGVSGTPTEIIHDDLMTAQGYPMDDYDVLHFDGDGQYHTDMGIFEDYDGPDNPNALPQEYLDSMDLFDKEWEEEREREKKCPNYEPMMIAQESSYKQELESKVPNALAEKLYHAFTKKNK